MSHRITWTVALFTMLLATTVLAQQRSETRTFTGTWTCLSCDIKGLDCSDHRQCDSADHKHCLRLNNGNYIFFLENEKSADLLKGTRKQDVKVTVKGIYYPKARTLDVQSYTIEGLKTAWCYTHQRMEMEASPSYQHTSVGQNVK